MLGLPLVREIWLINSHDRVGCQSCDGGGPGGNKGSIHPAWGSGGASGGTKVREGDRKGDGSLKGPAEEEEMSWVMKVKLVQADSRLRKLFGEVKVHGCGWRVASG